MLKSLLPPALQGLPLIGEDIVLTGALASPYLTLPYLTLPYLTLP